MRSLTAPEDPASRTPTAVTVDLEGGEGGGSSRAADLVLWTAGASPSTKDMPNLGYPFPRKGLPFPTNEQGSVLTVRGPCCWLPAPACVHACVHGAWSMPGGGR